VYKKNRVVQKSGSYKFAYVVETVFPKVHFFMLVMTVTAMPCKVSTCEQCH
jgi:hypothetical protein